MINPPQTDMRPLPGKENFTGTNQLFPENYPFDFSTINDMNYYWLKYYISQRTFFALPKRPIYINYEVLCNAFAAQVIDYSEADIYKLRNEEMSTKELEHFL